MANEDKDSVRRRARPRTRPTAEAGSPVPAAPKAVKSRTRPPEAGPALAVLEEQAATRPARRRAVANAAAAAIGGAFRPWSADEVATAFARFEAANPEPEGELDYHDPYTLLVAVVLSAQATDVGVNKATRGLFAAAPTPQAMVALGEEGVAQHIRTLGLYRGKAKNVVELSRRLIAEHGGQVPPDRAALETLPGVGRKTANVVLNIAFGLPTIAVDTHLFRIANRTGLAPGKTPLEVELGLERIIPARFLLHAHHWLILHGRYVCKALKPDCPRCLIADLCRWPEKTPA
ncbi:DNA-(apurinic or apyrimidinic site) lyase /endonuclease III [Ancylobacter aquaticus]|uniref:Endonuclease III n=1 Tax=Ancylobacter aquaticus TaxID=100 RepID=A0A4R1IC70_ANCAQ|nr:endonuclease III [Ancylobacter aquaticus]TCK30779.1 DNA-(apurinic or apyrimidinic site) lyase /endonuclease III [Ancylobacter aquaticus]